MVLHSNIPPFKYFRLLSPCSNYKKVNIRWRWSLHVFKWPYKKEEGGPDNNNSYQLGTREWLDHTRDLLHFSTTQCATI